MQQLFTVLTYWLIISACTFLVVIGTAGEMYGTHAMGSDLQFECLGGDTYRIRLTIYRACEGSALNQTQNIGFQSTVCGVPRFIQQANRVSITEISPLCPTQQPNSTCNGGLLPGIEEHVYELIHTFSNQCPDWQISWHLCCRNLSITNSVITNDTRMYIEAYLDNLNVSCNNSPFFTTPPVPYLCDGQPFNFNNGAVDPDGDSLGFELVNPLDFIALQGQITQVPYMPGFSPTYPMATSPAQNFNFSPITGQISFTPAGLQQGIVALLVTEYRNGVPIGSTMRDLQMVVINCNNVPPVIDPPSNISGGQFNGNTFSVCAGNTLVFDISGSDTNPMDVLIVNEDLGQTAANFSLNTTSPNNPWDGTFTWPTTLADIGNYYITFQAEDDGCPIQGEASVGYQIIVQTGEILPPMDLLVCPADSLDSVLVTTNIPADPGTYVWSPGIGLSDSTAATPFVYLNQVPISYTVTFFPNNPGDCPIVQEIHVKPELEIGLAPDTSSVCQGGSVQLNANVTFNGTQVPVTYLWAPAASLDQTNVANPVASPTLTTDYTVLVQTLTCDYVGAAHVIVDQVPTVSVPPTQNICAGESVQLNGSGVNLGSSSYSWSPILGLSDPAVLDPIASPTVTTTYTLTATNSCGSDAQSVTVNVAPPLSLSVSSQDLDCFGDNSGSISIIPFGGGSAPTYSWTPNVSSGATATNLPAGTYTVSALDASGCRDTLTTTLTEPPPLDLVIDTVINVSCFGALSGEISVSASGGTPGYEYSLDGTNFFMLNTFTNLPAGVYSITVRDANGCINSLSGINLSQPVIPIVATIDSITNTNCNNNLGEVYVSISGGTPQFSYTLNGTTTQPTGIFTGLVPGYYQVVVTDSLGCMDTVATEIIEVADPFLALDSIENISCYGGSDGVIVVTPTSGTMPYLFQLDGQLPLVTDTVFTGLSAGPHEVGLIDGNGCRYGLNVFLTEPDSLYGLVGSQTDVLCNGSNEGTLTVLPFGGVGGYSYSLDGSSPYGPDSTFTQLAAGAYNIFIQDANNCVAQVPAMIGEPNPILGSLQSQEDVSCFGLSDGSFIVTGTGGTPGYSYSFEGSAFVDSGAFSNLAAGTYQVLIMDDRGCLDSTDVVVDQPDPLGVELSDLTNVDCFEAATGSITVVGSGGTAPYEFAFDSVTYTPSPTVNGLAVGEYVVLIRDANGCMAQTEAEILQPTQLLGEVINEPITCFGDNDGAAMATAMGGTAPYAFFWPDIPAPQNQNANVNNLEPGNYIVVVTDANGCQLSMSTEIIEPPELGLDTTSSSDVTCFGGMDGMAMALGEGGLPPYTYSWSNGGSGSVQDALVAGTYRVMVQDTNGCMIEENFLIEEPDPLAIEVIDMGEAFCGLPTGFITVEVSGGVPEYQIFWDTDPQQEGPTAVDLYGDRPYQVSVIDMNGCPASLGVSVGVVGEPEASFYPDFAPLDSILWREDTYSFFNTSKNATAYSWDFGDGGLSIEEDPQHTYRDTGYYVVRLIAFDPNFACPDTAVVGFRLLPPGAIYVPNAFTPNGDGTNDFFHPVGIGVEEVEMKIFSRWGPLISTLNSMDEKWNGYLPDGEAAPEGVYVWVLEALINDGTEVHLVGNVTLFR